MESNLHKDYADMDSQDVSMRKKLEAINKLLDDPDVKSALLAYMAETES
jgi:hypothetical protein